MDGPRQDLIERNNATTQSEHAIARLEARVKRLEEQVKVLQRLSGRCECMNCIVIG